MDLSALAALTAGSFVLALSGALQPGPMFFATIAGVRRRGFWFGPWAILGHAAAELPVVGLLLAGLSAVLASDYVLAAIGAVGAVALTWMAVGMIRQALRPPPDAGDVPDDASARPDDSGVPSATSADAVTAPSFPVPPASAEPAGAQVAVCAQAPERPRPDQPASPSARSLAVEASAAGILTSILNPYWHLWWVTQPTLLLASAAAQGWPGVAAFFVGHISADAVWYSAASFGVARGRNFLRGRLYQVLLIGCGATLLAMAVLFARLVVLKLWGGA